MRPPPSLDDLRDITPSTGFFQFSDPSRREKREILARYGRNTFVAAFGEADLRRITNPTVLEIFIDMFTL